MRGVICRMAAYTSEIGSGELQLNGEVLAFGPESTLVIPPHHAAV